MLLLWQIIRAFEGVRRPQDSKEDTMNKKVEIKISEFDYRGERNRFAKSVHDGCEYVSVDYQTNNYGGCSPCITKERIKSATENAKRVILGEGDIPVVKDERIIKTINEWF